MKIKRGVDQYRMPEHSTVTRVMCKDSAGSYRLVLIGQHDMRIRRKVQDRPLGRPMYAAVYDNEVYLDPIPDSPAVMEVYYFPVETKA